MVATSFLVGGCQREPGDAKYTAVPGTIVEINLTNRIIKFRYKRTKTDEHRERNVWVPRDTEILINGRLSELSDLKLGERVFGIWRLEKTGGRDSVAAVSIRIVRENESQEDDQTDPSD